MKLELEELLWCKCKSLLSLTVNETYRLGKKFSSLGSESARYFCFSICVKVLDWSRCSRNSMKNLIWEHKLHEHKHPPATQATVFLLFFLEKHLTKTYNLIPLLSFSSQGVIILACLGHVKSFRHSMVLFLFGTILVKSSKILILFLFMEELDLT